MTNFEKLRESSRYMAHVLVHACADGCPETVEKCEKDKDGWDACEACWRRWLLMESGEET